MPKFSYTAKSGPTQLIDGVIEADNLDLAIKKVMEMGYAPLDVLAYKEESPASKAKKLLPSNALNFLKRIPLSAVVLFTRQMSDLVDSSVPLLKALDLIKNQTQDPNFKSIIEQMHAFVQNGGSLSGALDQHPDVFQKMYVNMVKSGEISGKLSVVLNRLAELLEKDQETKGKVTSSLAYPMFILIVGIVSTFVVITFIIPRLTVIFEDVGQELPLPTIILMNVSSFCASFWWLIIVLGAAIAFYVRRILSSPKGHVWFDHFKLKIPIVGDFIRDVEIGRFARILGTLLDSGVVIVAALKSVWAVLENEVLRQELQKASEEVTNGVSLAVALKQCPHFPEMAISMISIGEETGDLERGLYKLADVYERQSERTVRTILSLLGPVVLVLIVAMLGGLFIALLLPILQMNLVIS